MEVWSLRLFGMAIIRGVTAWPRHLEKSDYSRCSLTFTSQLRES